MSKIVYILRSRLKIDQIGSNWIKLDQTWSNLTKLVQTCSNWIKMDQIGSHLTQIDQTCSSWIKLDRTCSKWIKLVQTCPKWIKLVQNGSNWFKLVQNGLNLIKLDQTCWNWVKFWKTLLAVLVDFQSYFCSNRGTSGIDIDLRRVDIDQCPSEGVSEGLNIFRGTDKCKKKTTFVSTYLIALSIKVIRVRRYTFCYPFIQKIL